MPNIRYRFSDLNPIIRGDPNDSCKYRQFMRQFGVEIECRENCPIYCTPENKEKLDEMYGFMMQFVHIDPSGAVLYTGASMFDSGGPIQ